MKKIININLSGRVIPIEDAAYESLQRYIESLRRYFAAEEGRDEIINDIESRIAELMNDKVRRGADAVTESDIDEIIVPWAAWKISNRPTLRNRQLLPQAGKLFQMPIRQVRQAAASVLKDACTAIHPTKCWVVCAAALPVI
jgi:hypothetical protein